MHAPEITQDVPFEIILIRHKGRVKEVAAFKCVFMKHAPAKAVYGKDGCLIKGPEGVQKRSFCKIRRLILFEETA